jgi:hypothetical protein
MDDRDIRWKQRFVTFHAAFLRLKEGMDQEELNETD